mgnify:CR=1 FL=1
MHPPRYPIAICFPPVKMNVPFYLAKGFNAQYLQEKLFISEGTAKTHIRHIYGKMNVHSQQELMRIVNEVYVDD